MNIELSDAELATLRQMVASHISGRVVYNMRREKAGREPDVMSVKKEAYLRQLFNKLKPNGGRG